jgi:hypothetical protein
VVDFLFVFTFQSIIGRVGLSFKSFHRGLDTGFEFPIGRLKVSRAGLEALLKGYRLSWKKKKKKVGFIESKVGLVVNPFQVTLSFQKYFLNIYNIRIIIEHGN